MSAPKLASLIVLAFTSGCTCGGGVTRAFAEISVDPQSLDFGNHAPQSVTPLSLTITNVGSAVLEVGQVSVQGADATAFTLDVSSPTTLSSGAGSTLQVSFRPTGMGAFSARLVIASNATNTPQLSIPLIGTSNAVTTGDDAGLSDAGLSDAGLPDAGVVDGGTADAGMVDAGVADAGQPDAGCSLLLCGRAHSGVTCAVARDAGIGSFGGSWATSLFNDASGWNTVSTGRTVTFGDLDGDGRADVCGRGSAGVNCAFSTGATFSNFRIVSREFSDVLGWNAGPKYFATIQLADPDGDGRLEPCGRGDAGAVCAFADGGAWRSQSFNDATTWGDDRYFPSVQFADVTGDGRSDACGRGIFGISCSTSTGGGFGPYTGWSTEFSDADGWATNPAYFQTVQFPDVNGDGKADVCGRAVNGVACALSDGTRFVASTTWSTDFADSAGWLQRSQWSTLQFPDLNGDGKADVCGRAAAGLLCALSDGTRFVSPTATQLFNDASGWAASTAYYSTIQFADLDGDGQLDVCGRGTIGVFCALRRGGTFGSAFLTQAIADDTGGWADDTVYPTLRFVAGAPGSCRIGPAPAPAARVGP